MKFFKNLSKNFKKWKPVHTIICVLLILILSCATFCPHSCVFLPNKHLKETNIIHKKQPI